MNLFNAYDLRGRIPEDINEKIAYKIGRAYCEVYQPRTIAVGFDVRLESPIVSNALMQGFVDGGANVNNIGLCGTEEVYFATFNYELDGGIMVTASHNPNGYSGMKLVGRESRPISADTGLFDIKHLVETRDYSNAETSLGSIQKQSDKSAYINHLLSYIDLKSLTPLKILVNPGNGGAGIVLEQLENHFPFNFIYINREVNGNFPNGVPNPLLFENRESTAIAVRESGADLGIAWDVDFDRCFFFDADGRFIESCYIVSLLAEMMLSKTPNARIVHDPRSVWIIQDSMNKHNGKSIQSKCGHTYVKDVMRSNNAVYGGEMSGHHYFRNFSHCDSGMIPWLLIIELMHHSGKSLKELLDKKIEAYPCSGEINFNIEDPKKAFKRVKDHFFSMDGKFEDIDGISYSFDEWRFNLRASNTEPLVRLNVETKGDKDLLEKKVDELSILLL